MVVVYGILGLIGEFYLPYIVIYTNNYTTFSIDMFELFTRRDLGVSGRVFIADRESGKIRQVGVYTMFHSLRKLICSTNRLFGV
jgi:hypothetical protein